MHGKPELRAGFFVAGKADITTHALRQAFADGQPQAGTALGHFLGSEGFGKRIEQVVLDLRINATAIILNRHSQLRESLIQLGHVYMHNNIRTIAVLDRIGNQVIDQLGQAPLIAFYPDWNILSVGTAQFHAFLMGPRTEQLQGLINAALDVKYIFVELNLPGRDTGKVHNIVNQA